MEILPTNFPSSHSIDGHTIQYSDFIEICQGGPEVGRLIVDGKAIGDNRTFFGGPLLFFGNKMFVPQLKIRFFSKYFKLSVINLDDMSMYEIGDKEILILLASVDDTMAHFYVDLSNTEMKSVRWR